MTRPWTEWADRKYLKFGVLTHLVPFGGEYALCGAEALPDEDWMGTGDWGETARAEALLLCPVCEKAAE